MVANPSRTRWTWTEFARLPSEGGTRHEVIDGELVVTPAPALRHQRIATRLVALLHTFVRTHDLGEVFTGPVDVLHRVGVRPRGYAPLGCGGGCRDAGAGRGGGAVSLNASHAARYAIVKEIGRGGRAASTSPRTFERVERDRSVRDSARLTSRTVVMAVAVALSSLLVACGRAEVPQDAVADTLSIWSPTVVRDVRLFDGEEVIPRATVVFEEGRVAQIVLPGDTVVVPEGARTEDGSGRTLVPGLLDAHTHTLSRNYLKTATAFGVLLHVDMFTADLDFLRDMNKEERLGRSADRPDLISAGILVTAAGGHGTQYGVEIPTLDEVADADGFVEERLAEGSDFIKIVLEDGRAFGSSIPTLDEARVTAVVEAAHARGVLAVVHPGGLGHARAAIRAGADGLVHVPADSAPDPEFGRWAARHGIFVVPTLTVLDVAGGGSSGATVVEDPILRSRLDPVLVDNLLVEPDSSEVAMVRMEHAFEAVRMLHEAGVPILVGSDAPNPGTALGPSVHREMELLVEGAGLSPVEALRAATSATAAAFRLEGWRGRIVEGGRADAILVEGDPTTNILDTRDIQAIWKEGRRWKLELYLDEVAARRAAAGY